MADQHPSNDDHWLWRLSSEEWSQAADGELALARENARYRRRAVTHLRRAAGMYLNAILVFDEKSGRTREECESRWGRSYVDHLRALADSADCSPLPDEIRKMAANLLNVPLQEGSRLISESQLLRKRGGENIADAISIGEEIANLCKSVLSRSS